MLTRQGEIYPIEILDVVFPSGDFDKETFEVERMTGDLRGRRLMMKNSYQESFPSYEEAIEAKAHIKKPKLIRR